jgi:hypothetical protein
MFPREQRVIVRTDFDDILLKALSGVFSETLGMLAISYSLSRLHYCGAFNALAR